MAKIKKIGKAGRGYKAKSAVSRPSFTMLSLVIILQFI